MKNQIKECKEKRMYAEIEKSERMKEKANQHALLKFNRWQYNFQYKAKMEKVETRQFFQYVDRRDQTGDIAARSHQEHENIYIFKMQRNSS